MARRCYLTVILVIGGMGLLGSSLSNAMVSMETQLTNGTVSQGGVTVPLGSQSNCGLRGLLPESHCIGDAVSYLYGAEDHRLVLRTPGSVRVHLIAPVQFLKAGSFTTGLHLKRRRIRGFIHQQNQTEAVIKFRQPLRTGEVAWVDAKYQGKAERFFFLPVARRRVHVTRG